MEDWQKKHIKKNLVELIKNTSLNPQFIAQFTAAGILGSADEEELELPSMTRSHKAKKFYEILVTRVNSFDLLKKSLKATNQSGALQVEEPSTALFPKCGTITFDRNHILGTGRVGIKIFKGAWDERDVAVKVINTDVVHPSLALSEVKFLKKLDRHENIRRLFAAQQVENFVSFIH